MSDDWKPDWKLEPREVLAVALSLALPKVPGWSGATDEQLDAVAANLIEACGPAWMRDVLRARRDSLPKGDLRSRYNDAIDRLDVLDSKLIEYSTTPVP